jgi:DNA-binding response OmpR family regulator
MADILIIDDDEQIRELLIDVLEAAGHTVRPAGDGRGGLALFRRQPAELVITDIVMPGMEGIETIRELRCDAPGLPILAISGRDDPLYLRAADELGATATLEKPFTPVAFLAVVERLLAGQ